MESLYKRTENKCIQSDQEDIYYHNTSHHSSPRNSIGNEIPVNNVPVVPMEQQHSYYPSYPQNEVYPPYDPNRNLHYYNSLRNNSNNFGGFNNNNQINYRNEYQTSRVRKMDELYQGRGFGMNNMNRPPVIYTQNDNNQMDNRQYFNELNRSFTRHKEFGTGNDNILNNNYNINNDYGGRPFERNRPGNISQAMDILLDK